MTSSFNREREARNREAESSGRLIGAGIIAAIAGASAAAALSGDTGLSQPIAIGTATASIAVALPMAKSALSEMARAVRH